MVLVSVADDLSGAMVGTNWKNWFNAKFIDMKESKNFDYREDPEQQRTYFRDILNGKPEILLGCFVGSSTVKYIELWKELCPDMKVVVQSDCDYWWLSCPWLDPTDKYKLIRENLPDSFWNGLKKADLVFNVNWATHQLFKQRGIKCEWMYASPAGIAGPPAINSFVPPENWNITPMMYHKRLEINNGAAMFHSMYAYDPSLNIKLVEKLNLKPTMYSVHEPTPTIQQRMKIANPNGINVDRFSNIMGYMNDLNKNLFGFEDWYAGGSRFAIECALLGIPVVGSENAYAVKLLYPEFSCKNGESASLEPKIREIMKDREYYLRIGNKARDLALTHFSLEETKKRVISKVKDYTGVVIA